MENRLFSRAALLAVLLLVAYGIILAVFSIPSFPQSMKSSQLFPYLSDKPVGEDGFYMLTVAWNIARGEGITYNFLQPTTGIQPLYTFVQAGLAWLVQALGGDKWGFIRGAILLGVINLVIFSHLLGKIAAVIHPDHQVPQGLPYTIAFLITIFNFGLFRIFTYGLETGLYLILLAITVLYTIRKVYGSKSLSTALVFGVLSGLTVLARIDFILIIGVFLLIALFRKQLSFLWVLIAAGITALVTIPWFIYVFKQTGSLIPSSGSAQAGTITLSQVGLRLWEMLRAVISHLVPWIYSRPSVLLSLLALLIMLGLGILFLRTQNSRKYASSVFTRQPIYLSWLFAVFILLPVYLVAFQALHFYTRYIAPVEVVAIPLIGILLAYLLKDVSQKGQLGLALLLPLSFVFWASITLHTGAITNTQSVLAGFADEHFPASAKIGAFQSGVLGYFNPNVVNLDGKVNQDALNAQKNGQLAQYLDRENISILLDWPEIIQKKLPAKYLSENWEPCSELVPDSRSICLTRKHSP